MINQKSTQGDDIMMDNNGYNKYSIMNNIRKIKGEEG